MDTITFRPGDSTIWTFALHDGLGQPVDLTGATAWVEIPAVTRCARFPLVQVDGGFDWLMSDETMPRLPQGAYTSTFWIEWPDGLNDRGDFRLKIERGCP